MELEKTLKKALSTALVGSLLFLNQRCSKIPETRKLENIIIHEDYGNNPINLNLEQGNSALFDFPEKIPGAKEIMKYITPEARYCLVHIKQSHYKTNLSSKTQKKVKNVQSDIYKILLYLHNKLGIKEVYLEGITPEFEKSENKLASSLFNPHKIHQKRIEILKEHIDYLKEKINDKEFKDIVGEKNTEKYHIKWKEEINDLQEKIKKENEHYKKYKLAESHLQDFWSVLRLTNERKIKVRSAEDPTAQYIAELESDKFKKSEKATRKTMYAIYDNRERIVIEKITKQKGPLAIVVYGGEHVFGGEFSFGEDYKYGKRFSLYDNIAYWNSKNPDKKISLIEITPESWY
jgi:hypothetical protein